MKKSSLKTAVIYLTIGIVCLLLALFDVFESVSFLWGLTGAFIANGLVIGYRYFYWSKPENEPQYVEKLAQEKIELTDERKVMLRDKSGCITYHIMIGVYCALIIACLVANILGFYHSFTLFLSSVFTILLIFQYVCGVVIFNKLNKEL